MNSLEPVSHGAIRSSLSQFPNCCHSGATIELVSHPRNFAAQRPVKCDFYAQTVVLESLRERLHRVIELARAREEEE